MSTEQATFRPVTAITMGDPAGIGPEIVVGTMLDPSIIECCKPFVIGSAAILQKAADVLGKEIKIRKINDPDEATTPTPSNGARSSRWPARWLWTGS